MRNCNYGNNLIKGGHEPEPLDKLTRILHTAQKNQKVKYTRIYGNLHNKHNNNQHINK